MQEGADRNGRGDGAEGEHPQEGGAESCIPQGRGLPAEASQGPGRVNPCRLTPFVKKSSQTSSRVCFVLLLPKTKRSDRPLYHQELSLQLRIWVCVFCLNPLRHWWRRDLLSACLPACLPCIADGVWRWEERRAHWCLARTLHACSSLCCCVVRSLYHVWVFLAFVLGDFCEENLYVLVVLVGDGARLKVSPNADDEK